MILQYPACLFMGLFNIRIWGSTEIRDATGLNSSINYTKILS